jgi:type IV pilus assembly protein PilW
MTGARSQGGVSLVQVMIGTGIGVALSMALGSFFVNSSRSGRGDINVAAMLDEMNFAANALTADLEMAGFWAQAHDPTVVTVDGTAAISGSDCGKSVTTSAGTVAWYRALTAVEVLDNPAAATAVDRFPCLVANDLVAGADIIAVKRVLGRVAGTDTSAAGLRNGALYLRTHNRAGMLFLKGGAAPASIDTPYQDWEYAPALYFVQKYTRTAAESPQVPALCRMILRSTSGGAPAFTRECVAQGVENLQVEIGVDTDEDGSANYFTQAPTAADLNRASTARVYLQVRAARKDVDYKNEKTYQIGNADAFKPAGDDVHYYRKALTAEVALHNPRALMGVAVQ